MIAENTILFNKNKPRENYIKKEVLKRRVSNVKKVKDKKR